MKRMIRSISMFVLLIHFAAIASADWPMIRGPLGTGQSTETSLRFSIEVIGKVDGEDLPVGCGIRMSRTA